MSNTGGEKLITPPRKHLGIATKRFFVTKVERFCQQNCFFSSSQQIVKKNLNTENRFDRNLCSFHKNSDTWKCMTTTNSWHSPRRRNSNLVWITKHSRYYKFRYCLFCNQTQNVKRTPKLPYCKTLCVGFHTTFQVKTKSSKLWFLQVGFCFF